MILKTKIRQRLVALLIFTLMMGGGIARAIEIDANDLILVLYGNKIEYYQFIDRTDILHDGGGVNTYSVPGSGLSAAGRAGTIRWALVAVNTDTGDFFGNPTTTTFSYTGPRTPRSVIADYIYLNEVLWAGKVFDDSTDPASGTFPRGERGSFFDLVDFGSGNGRLGVLPPGTSAAASYGETLQILEGNYLTGVVTDTEHTATLALINPSDLRAGAILTINGPLASPAPASLLLFASGLAGLIGIRRRLLSA
jgi:hypothetical protein